MRKSACPSASRLLAVALGEVRRAELANIEHHLRTCVDCYTRLENLRNALPEDKRFLSEPVPEILRNFHRSRPHMKPSRAVAASPSAGDIWLVCSTDGTNRRLVLVLGVPGDDDILAAALLSPEIDMASDRDVILSEEQSPLSYPIMVEAWNQFPIIATQCIRYHGKLDSQLAVAIRRLGGVSAPDTLPGLQVGRPLTSADDPRSDFQLQEANIAQTLSAMEIQEPDEERLVASVRENEFAKGFEQHTKWFEQRLGHMEERTLSSLIAFCYDEPSTKQQHTIPLACGRYGDYQIFILPETPHHIKCELKLTNGILGWKRQGEQFQLWFEGIAGSFCKVGPKEAPEPTITLSAGEERLIESEERTIFAPHPSARDLVNV